ncbi:MAG: hypothetical protein NTZ38_03600 [Candidatus Taylorbacteria bacterium]|nr:hypothetical protein [Candidatus Taylorbacteria bacterium]
MEGEKFENPYIDRLVGIPKEYLDKQQENEHGLATYMEKKGARKMEGVEIEKTTRDIEILKFAEESATAVMQAYGRSKNIQISLDHIHVLRVGGTKELTKGRLEKGSHSSTEAGIMIDRVASDIEFCLIAFHEIIHTKSYTALQIIGEKGNRYLKHYRSGFVVNSRDGKESFFNDLD